MYGFGCGPGSYKGGEAHYRCCDFGLRVWGKVFAPQGGPCLISKGTREKEEPVQISHWSCHLSLPPGFHVNAEVQVTGGGGGIERLLSCCFTM